MLLQWRMVHLTGAKSNPSHAAVAAACLACLAAAASKPPVCSAAGCACVASPAGSPCVLRAGHGARITGLHGNPPACGQRCSSARTQAGAQVERLPQDLRRPLVLHPHSPVVLACCGAGGKEGQAGTSGQPACVPQSTKQAGLCVAHTARTQRWGGEATARTKLAQQRGVVSPPHRRLYFKLWARALEPRQPVAHKLPVCGAGRVSTSEARPPWRHLLSQVGVLHTRLTARPCCCRQSRSR